MQVRFGTACWFLIKMNLVLCLAFFTFLVCCVESSVSQDQKDSNKPTKCDETIAKVMCDEFQSQTKDCAELMPEDEQQFFKECSEELGVTTSENWSDILSGMCAKKSPAQTAFDMVSCWDEKRNETLDQIKNDKIYPYEHFMCKLKIFKESIGQTDCACQAEKGFTCGIPPAIGGLK